MTNEKAPPNFLSPATMSIESHEAGGHKKGCSSHMIEWRVTNFCQPQAQHRLWLTSTSSPAAMAHDPPPLALSDIMRSFTPSPGHEGEVDEDQDHVRPGKSRSISPEPLEQSEIDSMKSRLLELGIGTSREPSFSTRERELVDMVLKISPLPRSRSNLPIPASPIHCFGQIGSLTTCGPSWDYTSAHATT